MHVIKYIRISVDAYVVGDIDSQRSTSGFSFSNSWCNTSFPISAGSKRQSSVSHATLEAEIVAADFGLRTGGVPSLALWRNLCRINHR